MTAARITFQPGWRWSECIKPVVGTDSCQARHVGTVASGRLHVVHEDGSEAEATPGAVDVIEPGHDAWVVADEPFVSYEFESAETYAKVGLARSRPQGSPRSAHPIKRDDGAATPLGVYRRTGCVNAAQAAYWLGMGGLAR